jgi:hypothetical protein
MPGAEREDFMSTQKDCLFRDTLRISDEQILRYEIARAWWPQFVSISWMQRLASMYFAWKTKRISARFRELGEMMDRVEKGRKERS